MAKLELLMVVAEICSEFYFDDNLKSMDINELSCLNCKNWDGYKCGVDMFDKVIENLNQSFFL